MMDTMAAVVYTAPEEMTYIPEYRSTQQDRDDDVLLRIQSVGICGSDMHAYHGKDPLGHSEGGGQGVYFFPVN